MNKKQLAILVDGKDEVVDYREKLRAHEWPTPLHRAVSVVVFNGDEILLQRRSAKKPVWPLYWSNTCCGNVLKGESYEECAKRRLKEEMGVTTSLKEMFVFKYKAKYDESYGEHELDHVFVGEYSGKIKINHDEAVDYKWTTKDQLFEDLKSKPDGYTPWFKIIAKKLLDF